MGIYRKNLAVTPQYMRTTQNNCQTFLFDMCLWTKGRADGLRLGRPFIVFVLSSNGPYFVGLLWGFILELIDKTEIIYKQRTIIIHPFWLVSFRLVRSVGSGEFLNARAQVCGGVWIYYKQSQQRQVYVRNKYLLVMGKYRFE